MGDRNFHNRRSIRLKGYDYAKSGAYFVTICCKDQQCFFGRIENREIKLTTIGKIVKMNWENIPCYFKNVTLDEYVIMPNHMHGVIVINDDDFGGGGMGLINQTHTPTTDDHTPTINSKFIENNELIGDNNWIMMKNPNMILGKIIRFFKARSTRLIRQTGYKNFAWQRNYYEHIIHSKNDINRIRKYIIENPLKWRVDKFKI